jgi:hypothetical protein
MLLPVKLVKAGALWRKLFYADYRRLSLRASDQVVLNNESYTVPDVNGRLRIILTGTLTANRTLTLPTLGDNQACEIEIVNQSPTHATYEWIVDGEGAETINGTLTWSLKTYGERVRISGTPTTWVVVDCLGTFREYLSTSVTAQDDPTSIWYNLGGHSITLEPGVWSLRGGCRADGSINAGVATSVFSGMALALSTSPSSASHGEALIKAKVGGTSAYGVILSAELWADPEISMVVLAVSTTFYLLVQPVMGGTYTDSSVVVRGDGEKPTRIAARRIG